MTDSTLRYLEQYRNKLRELEESQTEWQKAREEVRNLALQSNAIADEISAMRRIITRMIDTGMDPVETKLKMNDEDRLKTSNTLWDMHDVITIDTGQLATQAAWGAAGSIGAVGAGCANGATSSILTGQSSNVYKTITSTMPSTSII